MSNLSLEDIQNLSEEIRHLVKAGMPLEKTLADAGRGRGRRLQKLTQTISEELSQGRTLQSIVEHQPAGSSRMLASAVGAGVQAGDLSLTIELMGDFASDIINLRSKLLQAAAYPLTIVAVACVLILLIVQHTLEVFLWTFESWNVQVHPVLMTLLQWNRQMPWWTMLLPVVGILMVLFWVTSGRAAAMTFRGPERILFLLPGVWALVRDLQNYTVTRMMSLLTERGLPLQDSLTLAGGASGSARLEAACRATAKYVQQGSSAGDASKRFDSHASQLPPLLGACLKQVDRDEGRMVHRLRSVAEFYRTRMERNIAWLKLMMPVLMFIVIGGGCVLTYALMVFWPVSEMYRSIGS